MTTETQTYPNESSWRRSTQEGTPERLARSGWQPVSKSKPKLQTTWSNDPPPPPTAEKIREDELKVKLKDDIMTHKELLELLRVTGIIG